MENLLNIEKLPKKLLHFSKRSVETTLEGIDPTMIMLQFMFAVAYIMAFRRAKLQSMFSSTPTPVHLYMLIFGDSGSGKDWSRSFVFDELLKNVRTDHEYELKDLHASLLNQFVKDAENRFKDNETSRAIHIRDNKPREAQYIQDKGTPEALYVNRRSLSKYNVGCHVLLNSEVGVFFKTLDQGKEQIIELINNAFDTGKTMPSSYKNQSEMDSVFYAPQMVQMHGSKVAFEQKNLFEKLKQLLSEGMGRRFLTYHARNRLLPADDEIEENFEKLYKGHSEIEDFKIEVDAFFKEIDYALKETNLFVLTKEAGRRMYEYDILMRKESENEENELIKIQKQNTKSRIQKLAPVMQMFVDPKERNIGKEVIDMCIEFLEKLIENNVANTTGEASYAEKIYRFLKEKNDYVKLVEIKKKFDMYRDNINFERVLSDVDEIASNDGYELLTKKIGRGVVYRIGKPEPVDIQSLEISQANTNSYTDTTYLPTVIDFENLHKITAMDKAYSLTTFKDNKRLGKNAIPKIAVIGLDIDEGYSLQNAKNYLKKQGIKSLIFTTKSHQKVKKTESGKKLPAVDRYRILIPLQYYYCPTSPQEFKDTQKAFWDTLPFNPDPATNEIARFWYGNPQQQHEYIEGKPLNLLTFVSGAVKNPPKTLEYHSKKTYKAGNTKTLGWLFEHDKEEFLRRLNFASDGKTEQDGGRNDFLARTGRWLKDEQMDFIAGIHYLNSQFYEKLPDREIKTIIESIQKS